MARIRTIKPEFWMSESMGRLSRDARLLFIGLWSQADDEGRFRAHPRLLAAELFAYDEGALELLPGWLAELAREGCVDLYEVDGNSYGVIPRWFAHQKIDRRSKSKLPERVPPIHRESPPIPREASCEDQGTGNREQGMDQGTGIFAGNKRPRPKTAPEEEVVDLVTGKPVSSGEQVFLHWQRSHPRAVFDGKRKRLVAARLKEGRTVEELKQAIDGCAASPWHQGLDPKNPTKCDDLSLICRDAEHVEKFIELAQGPKLTPLEVPCRFPGCEGADAKMAGNTGLCGTHFYEFWPNVERTGTRIGTELFNAALEAFLGRTG